MIDNSSDTRPTTLIVLSCAALLLSIGLCGAGAFVPMAPATRQFLFSFGQVILFCSLLGLAAGIIWAALRA